MHASPVSPHTLHTPVKVQHGRDAVETKPIHSILFNEPFQIGEEESRHLPLTVVKDL